MIIQEMLCLIHRAGKSGALKTAGCAGSFRGISLGGRGESESICMRPMSARTEFCVPRRHETFIFGEKARMLFRAQTPYGMAAPRIISPMIPNTIAVLNERPRTEKTFFRSL